MELAYTHACPAIAVQALNSASAEGRRAAAEGVEARDLWRTCSECAPVLPVSLPATGRSTSSVSFGVFPPPFAPALPAAPRPFKLRVFAGPFDLLACVAGAARALILSFCASATPLRPPPPPPSAPFSPGSVQSLVCKRRTKIVQEVAVVLFSKFSNSNKQL